MRIGIGYDVHRLVKDRELILGGVKIDFQLGLDGHSDADVLTHAIMDAILGAIGQGDIGRHFPDTDEKYKGISSMLLLKEVFLLLRQAGYVINNLDSIIVAERPKMNPYIGQMVINLSEVLAVERGRINIKATTTERLGFAGKGQGIAAQAAVTIKRNS